jgi:hypothetical protein
MRKANWNADDKSLCIQKGNLVSGIFNKELVGQGAGVNSNIIIMFSLWSIYVG